MKSGNKSRRAPHEVIAVKPPGTVYYLKLTFIKNNDIIYMCNKKCEYSLSKTPIDTLELKVQIFLFTSFGYITALVSMHIWWIWKNLRGM